MSDGPTSPESSQFEGYEDDTVWIRTELDPNTAHDQIEALVNAGAKIFLDGDLRRLVVLIPTRRAVGSGNPFLSPRQK